MSSSAGVGTPPAGVQPTSPAVGETISFVSVNGSPGNNPAAVTPPLWRNPITGINPPDNAALGVAEEIERHAGLSIRERGNVAELAEAIAKQSVDMADIGRRAVNDDVVVQALFDAWNKHGCEKAHVILAGLDHTMHAGYVTSHPRRVIALSLMRLAGSVGSGEALRSADLWDHTTDARIYPASVFALTHIEMAGHETAGLVKKGLDVSELARRAEEDGDPLAVFALSHLDNSQNPWAKPAMQKLNTATLVSKGRGDKRIVPALGVLMGAGNANALDELIKLIEHNHNSLDELFKAAAERPDLKSIIMDKLLGKVTKSKHVAKIASGCAKRNNVAVDVLKLAVQAARDVDNLRAAALAVSLAKAGERNPYALIAVSEVYNDNMHEARDVLRTMNCKAIAESARSADRPTSDRAISALRVLCSFGNNEALDNIITLIAGNPRAMLGPGINWDVADPGILDRIRALNFSKSLFSDFEFDDNEKSKIIESLYEFARRDCESALELLLETARGNAYALMKLDRLRFDLRGRRDVSAMITALDVSGYREAANESLQVVMMLQFPAMMNNSTALNILENVDARILFAQMKTGEENEFWSTAEVLVKHNNRSALGVLCENAEQNEGVLSRLQAMYNLQGQLGFEIRRWFSEAAKREDEFGEKVRLWLAQKSPCASSDTRTSAPAPGSSQEIKARADTLPYVSGTGPGAGKSRP